MGRHRKGRALRRAGIVGLTSASMISFAVGAWADTVALDGDTATPGGSPAAFSTALNNCSGTTTGTIDIKYNGSASQHFAAGEALTVTFYPPAGSGISAQTVNTPPHMPSTWDSTSPDFVFDFTTSISSTTLDNIYQVGVQVAGDTSGYAVGHDAGSGRPQYGVTVGCGNTAPVQGNTPPTIAWTSHPTSANEGDTKTYTFSFTDPDADTWAFATGSPSCGTGNGTANTVSNASIDQTAKTGTFDCYFDDGPSTPTVSVAINDGTAGSNTLTESPTVANVAPTIQSITPNVSNVLVGQPVTFTGSATDPSGADTTAGFNWKWSTDGSTYGSYGAAGANTFTTTFNSCGSNTVYAIAKDKDGGESTAAQSSATSSYDAQFLAPLTAGSYNMVQKGSVVPVKIWVGCGTTFLGGLSPAIQLLSGEVDPNTDPGDTSLNITTTSVSAADTTGIMRQVDGQYIYNLQVPNGSTGAMYTVRVRPFGTTSSGSMYVVLKLRK